MPSTVLIIGTGLAGYQTATALRDAGFDGDVTLIGDEAPLPYHRPPLSKAFLLGTSDAARLGMRPEKFYADKGIRVLRGKRAIHIDREHHMVGTDDGQALRYDELVLATGARNRPLPVEGVELRGVHSLRTLADAQQLKDAFGTAREAVVIGAGFIGMEFAAAARKAGLSVTVLDIASRAMARAVSPVVSSIFEGTHARTGVRFQFETGVVALEGVGGDVTAVITTDGQHLPCQLVLIGIGVIPNDELARECGLAVDNGIVVDGALRTSDPHIHAIGDCAVHPSPHAGGVPTRIESVQTATDQARFLAAHLMRGASGGQTPTYDSLPWFWSDQGELKLQIAGLAQHVDEVVVHAGAQDAPCSVYCFRRGRLVGVESINRPGDHMAARKLLAAMAADRTLAGPAPVALADPAFDLKDFTTAMLAASA